MKIGQFMWDSKMLYKYEIVSKTENKKGVLYKLKLLEKDYDYGVAQNPTICNKDAKWFGVASNNSKLRFFTIYKKAQLEYYTEQLRDVRRDKAANIEYLEASTKKENAIINILNKLI